MQEETNFRNKQKEKLLGEWLEKLDHVLVHLDSRKENVALPEEYKNNPTLTLKLSYNFQGQITLDQELVSAYLKFSGSYFECKLPWEAIWGITGSDENNKIWTEDVPKELVIQMAKQKLGEFKDKLFGSKKKGPEETLGSQATSKEDKKDRKSKLTRIK